MGLREVRKELESMEKHMLIHHISEVYKRYPEVKEYFDFYADPDEEKLLDRYKTVIYQAFYPTRGKKPKFYKARKALNAFKKIAVSPEVEAALLIYYVQVAIMYARDRKPGTESFYTKIESSFRTALEYLEKHELLAEFEQECAEMTERTQGLLSPTYMHMSSIRERFYGASS